MEKKINFISRIWHPLFYAGLDQIDPFDPFYIVCKGTNLLCTYLILLSLVCGAFLYDITGNKGIILGSVGAAFLFSGVILLNKVYRFELAKVCFFLIINLTLVYFSFLAGQPSVVLLTYLLELSLVFFLFESVETRLICIGVIVLRIFAFKVNYENQHYSALPVASYTYFYWISFIILLTLIVFVFYEHGSNLKKMGKLFRYSQFAKKTLTNANLLNDRKNVFFKHASHDIRAAYFSVDSLCKQLKYANDHKDEPKNKAAIIDNLADTSNFFSYLLNNYFEYAKYRDGELDQNHIEELDIAWEIEHIVNLYKHFADGKKLSLSLDIDSNVPGLIRSDKIKISRICLNLLSNAIKFTPQGKAISVLLKKEEHDLSISISNEGPALPEEVIKNLFTYTENRENRRWGFGLPITKQLIESLNGSIHISSEPQKETCITVLIPLTEY